MPGTLDEMAHGIVSVLKATPQPEPLRVELNGHTYQEALYLAQAVADECSAAGTSLALVEVGDAEAFAPGGSSNSFDEASVHLRIVEEVGSELRFYRWQKPDPHLSTR